jgi:predicted secreted protein
MKPLVLTEKDNGKTFLVSHQQKVLVNLDWQPTSGNMWQPAESTAASFEGIEHGENHVTFEYLAHQDGTIQIELAKPFREREEAERVFQVKVVAN